jgi:arylsulfatase A-like enzyme
MPTILDWLGIEVPLACDGVSLTPWLRGDTPATWRDAVQFEYDLRGGWPEPATLPDGAAPEAGPMAAMRTRRWKLVHMPGLPSVLYDLAADPDELRNIAADPAARPLLLEASQRMLDARLTHAAASHTGVVATPDGLVPRALPRRGMAG